MRTIWKRLFGCRHKQLSWPHGPENQHATPIVQCHTCKRRLEYSFQQMRVIREYQEKA